ncbi:MAG TPA: ABC transporter substrate-binding protein [Chloroflexota bacterium]|nr:ABC transporter substrate-binding protein [Chloroflexota bacterium]
MRRGTPATGFALALALVLVCCSLPSSRPSSITDIGSAPPSAPAAPKRIVAAIMGDPPTLSNTINSAGGAGVPGASEVGQLVTAGLSSVDVKGKLHPQLADAVPSTDNGLWKVADDGTMETTWHLRSGIVWQDGAPFTSEDLAFTVAIGQDKDVPLFRDLAFDSIRGTEQPDAQTFIVHWNRPFIQADGLLATDSVLLPVPKHIVEKPYLDNRAALGELPYWGPEFVGTGPFKLKEWVAGSHLLLVANDAYVLGRPKVDEIEVKFIPDPDTLSANILAGSVELTLGRSLSLDEALQVGDQWRDGKIETDVNGWLVMYPQLLTPEPAAIGDPRFRRGLLSAIDRQTMADTLLRPGMSQVAHFFLGPNEPDYDDVEGSAVKYPYDARQATQLVESVGFRRGQDGVLRDAAGQPVSVEIRNRGIEIGRKSVFAVADYWKQIGLAVETTIIPPQRAQDRPYMATFPGFLLYNQPSDINFLKRIHSSQTPLPENGFVGQNNSRYVDKAFDALIDRLFITIPRGERMRILGQIVHEMTDQALLLGLFYNLEPQMIGARLVNVGAGPPWNAGEWDVRK